MKEKEFIEITLKRLSGKRDYSWIQEIEQLGIINSVRFPIERLFQTYVEENIKDFLSHLRQICVYQRGKIRVPEKVFKWAKLYKNEFGFDLDIDSGSVAAKPNVMIDVPDLCHSFSFSKKRHLKQSFPDATLVNVFGFESYISIQQKMMIHTLKKMNKGSTLLACLPTGSGKSLLWQYGVAAGKFKSTVVVIVPTNALATDHAKSDKELLAKLPWVKSIAYSAEQYGGKEERLNYLCEQIINEEPLILYISPEGLTNSLIKKALLDSALHKNLSAIVIDESHLIIDWGMKFRPEFQFLPGLLHQVKEKSDSSIYTILLSATYTDMDKKILLELFADQEYHEFRGGELRPEPSFYRHHCKSEEEREKLLLQLIPVVPKPAIVYVGTVANSEIYERRIKQAGFKRVARFNGDTNYAEREYLISQWRDNKIDIMVATSAFGMGVDKADVRTIITAYTPENISRYYQEVGRSGRDGYASLNFALYCPIVDSGLVGNNTDKKLISTDNLWKRWKALQEAATVSTVPGENDCYILDTDTKHEGLTYELTGGYNSGWNDNVISMLARAGYVSIIDVWRKGNIGNHKAFYIKIRVHDIDICFDEERYKRKIDEFREKERYEIVKGKESVKALFQTDNLGCYGNTFRMVFSYPSRLCGGCPFCRMSGASEYYEASKLSYISNVQMQYKKNFHFRNFASVCTDSKSVSLIGSEKQLSVEELNLLIEKMMIAEANIFVLASCEILDIKRLLLYESKEILVLSIEELYAIPDAYICGTIVYVLGKDELINQKMLKYQKRCLKRKKEINQIFIADIDYYYHEEKRRLADYVEDVKLVNTILGEEKIC